MHRKIGYSLLFRFSNVPNLRFPEFTGEWETVALEDICDKIGDGIHSTPNYDENGDYFFINGNNLVNGRIQISETTKRVTKREAEQHNTSHLAENTVLISINGTIGNLALYSHEQVMLGKSACYINPRASKDRLFVFYQLGSRKIYNYFISELTGSTIKNLSLKSIRQTVFHLPSIEEQKKIGQFLSLLDKRIETQNKIIEQYKSLIKGIYTFLLGECDKYRKLGEFCQIKKGEQINRTELSDDGKYYVMNGGITSSGSYHSYNTEANTISISEGGNSCGYVQYNDVPFWSGGHCYTLEDIDKDIYDRYLFHYLKANEPQIMALRIGSGLPNIQKKDLCHFCVPLPLLLNQKEIANTLDKIMAKIELEEFLISAYQKQKRHLLQNLFI